MVGGADTGSYSLKNEKAIEGMGVTRVAVPSRNCKSRERRNCREHVGSEPDSAGEPDVKVALACSSGAHIGGSGCEI